MSAGHSKLVDFSNRFIPLRMTCTQVRLFRHQCCKVHVPIISFYSDVASVVNARSQQLGLISSKVECDFVPPPPYICRLGLSAST